MSSFKLERSDAKGEMQNAGALLVVLGLFAAILIHPVGVILAIAGLAALVASKYASR